jgi:hypothetical protein
VTGVVILAHAGHWLGSLLYVAPVALIAGAVGFNELRSKRAAAEAPEGE